MNPEYEGGIFYISFDDGSVTPLGNISYVELEGSSPSDGGVYEHEETIKKLSEAAFEITGVITNLSWHLRKYYINNWRRNHGLPAIRKSKRRIKYGQ